MKKQQQGFTLIELSIVLVIIGLLAGGVLVGRDLIRAAEVRATISQIEKFNTAKNTFYLKYGYLPGDLNAAAATQFGFTQRGSGRGEGDGNGVIEGDTPTALYQGITQISGETSMFWVDLTSANGQNLGLIDGTFNTASPIYSSATQISGTSLSLYFPSAKLGGGNLVYVWSGGNAGNDGQNYYGIANISPLAPFVFEGGCANFGPGMTVQQAYNIDNKIDDGLPNGGLVQTYYTVNCSIYQSSNAVSPSFSTCSDQNGNASNPFKYSLGQNSGNGVNCALSIRFQ